MFAKKLYVSATDAAGAYLVRGMFAEEKALREFDDFAKTPASGHALFMVISAHDGRIELRPTGDNLYAGRIVGQNRRDSLLWGLLGARAPVVWEPEALGDADIRQLIHALYVLPREAFKARVSEEAAR